MSEHEANSFGGELSHPSITFAEWVEGASIEGGNSELPPVRDHPFDTSSDPGIEARFPYGQSLGGEEIIDPRDIRGGADPNQALHGNMVVRGTVQLGLTFNSLTNEPEPVATFATTRQLLKSGDDSVFVWSREQILQVPLYTGNSDPKTTQSFLQVVQAHGLKRLVVDMKVVPGYAIGQSETTQYGEITHVYASERTHRKDDPLPRFGESVVLEGTVVDQQLHAQGDAPATVSLEVDGQVVTVDSALTYPRLDKQVNLHNPQIGIDPPTVQVGDTVQMSVFATADGKGFSTHPYREDYFNYSPDITNGTLPAVYLVQGGAERETASFEETASFNNYLNLLAGAKNAQEFREAAGRLLSAYLNPDSATQDKSPFLLSDQQLEALYEVARSKSDVTPQGLEAPLITIASPYHEMPGKIQDYARVQAAFGDFLRAQYHGNIFSISRAELTAVSAAYLRGSVRPEFSQESGKELLNLLKAAQPEIYHRITHDSLTATNLDTLCSQPGTSAESLATTLRILLTNGREWAADEPARADHIMHAYTHLLESPHKTVVDPQLDTMLWGMRRFLSQAAEFKDSIMSERTDPDQNSIVALKNPALAVVITHTASVLDQLDEWINTTPRAADELVDNPSFSAIRQFLQTSDHYRKEVAKLRHYTKLLADYRPHEKWGTRS